VASRKTSRRARSKAPRRRGFAEAWITRLFWLGVIALCAYLSVERVAKPVMALTGYRRVEHYAELLNRVGDEFRLDPNLLAGMMLAESSGRIDAVSKVDALGLFQLMLPTARERARLLRLPEPTREDLLSDAELNARLAGSYLRWLDKRYDGDLEKMLIAYNAGPGRLDGWIKQHGGYAAWRASRDGSSQVLAYARKVQSYRDHFVERGVVTPPYDQPPVPAALAPLAPPDGRAMVGPPAPQFAHDS